jgi:ZIP family zinc transporter/zinc and cadmium transporter
VTDLTFALIAAGGNILGGLAAVRGAKLGIRIISGFVAFGAGFMIAVSVTQMLPEALQSGGRDAMWFVLAGYLLVHLTQHTATQHFHFGEETHEVPHVAGITALIGLLMHTFFDGVAIASGFAVSPALGVLVFLAIVLHKLPEGLTITSLQLAGGTKPARALGSAALLGAATVIGVLTTDAFSFLTAHGLAISAGVTLYVAASNLVPEFQSKRGYGLPIAFFLGAAMAVGMGELLAVVGVR